MEEALQAFRDSVDDYLDFCKQAGVEPDRPYSGKPLIRIKPEHHRDLSLIAQEQGRSINALVAQLVTRAIRMRGKRIPQAPIEPSGDERSSKGKPGGRAASKSPPRTRQDPPAPGPRKRVKAR